MIPFLFGLFVIVLPFASSAQQASATVEGRRYIGCVDEGHFTLHDSRGKTVLKPKGDYYIGFDFKDFNRDGYKDILLELNDNTPSRHELFLYNAKTHRFKEVRNFYDYPAAEPIKGTKYYYSYFRAGCADNTWGSDLFYIRDYTTVKVANIKGEGCGIKDGIYIYKITLGKKVLVKTLPLNTIEKYKDYKWGFIKQYWTRNYSKFL